ncbi:hypothetical protein XA68_14523 [Ophiocordyceps unilateralis]|uniref:Uncharacterized protein n=1 Tax=Ophiocordyceps unilateralis TaxID=268505 RepID=A0A2A9PAE5_OPHUN|nr:hypothetical protein XA68_14523 [Ophiocordyceps unilateralis]
MEERNDAPITAGDPGKAVEPYGSEYLALVPAKTSMQSANVDVGRGLGWMMMKLSQAAGKGAYQGVSEPQRYARSRLGTASQKSISQLTSFFYLGGAGQPEAEAVASMIQGPAYSARPWLRQLGPQCWRICNLSTSTPSSARSASPAIALVKMASPTQPPSARPIDTRKSQLIRIYTSLLRSSPVILLFQHSNLVAGEWSAVRRELRRAIAAVSASDIAGQLDLSKLVQLQVLTTKMFSVALKITEFYNPEAGEPLTHDLSQAAYDAVRTIKPPPESSYAQLEPLMVGPLAALVLPAISPAYMAAALSVLAPVPGKFPAPTRKKCPGYHDPICQSGLAKLVLVGGRIERKIFDRAGVDWVAGLEGGLDGLRSQLLRLLQGAGLGLTTALESGGRSIWLALEGRKDQLDKQKHASSEAVEAESNTAVK